MLVSKDKSVVYTGISTDPQRRLRQHNGELAAGAKFTRNPKYRPWTLAYIESSENRSSATKRELQLKRLTHSRKLKICNML